MPAREMHGVVVVPLAAQTKCDAIKRRLGQAKRRPNASCSRLASGQRSRLTQPTPGRPFGLRTSSEAQHTLAHGLPNAQSTAHATPAHHRTRSSTDPHALRRRHRPPDRIPHDPGRPWRSPRWCSCTRAWARPTLWRDFPDKVGGAARRAGARLLPLRLRPVGRARRPSARPASCTRRRWTSCRRCWTVSASSARCWSGIRTAPRSRSSTPRPPGGRSPVSC